MGMGRTGQGRAGQAARERLAARPSRASNTRADAGWHRAENGLTRGDSRGQVLQRPRPCVQKRRGCMLMRQQITGSCQIAASAGWRLTLCRGGRRRNHCVTARAVRAARATRGRAKSPEACPARNWEWARGTACRSPVASPVGRGLPVLDRSLVRLRLGLQPASPKHDHGACSAAPRVCLWLWWWW